MKTSKVFLWAALSSLVALGVACSSSDEPSGEPPTTTKDGSASTGEDGSSPVKDVDASVSPTVEAACSAFADALCAKIQSCTAFGLAALYVDVDTCKERQVLACKASSAATGQKGSADTLESCASSLSALSCPDVTSVKLGASCRIPGTLANGGACGYDSQCASSFCALAGDKQCGVCAEASTQGGACVNGACSAGYACSPSDSKCYAPGTAQVGASCQRLSDCDIANGAACNTLTNKCIEVVLAGDDGKCGVNGLGNKYTTCRGGAACSSTANGQCAAIADDGASCAASGPSCMAPARCVSGKCVLPSPSCE